MKKSIDATFLHYGIKQDDMQLIVQACKDNDIDPDWLKENILKPYNEERNNQNIVEEKKIKSILKKALKAL